MANLTKDDKVKRVLNTKARLTIPPKMPTNLPTLSIESLDLSNNGLRDPKVFGLFEFGVSKYSKLSILNLANNPLGSEGIRAMMLSIKEPNCLTQLDLT
jgi:Ran GTPase-activating protein (RanGAP) involved in mRNA processing and transport